MESDEKDLVLSRCTRHFSLRSTKLYRAASRLIFPRLVSFLLSNDRDYVVRSLECFGRLCFVQENVDLLNPTLYPDLPSIFVELMRVSTTMADPIVCCTGRLDHDEALNWSSKPAAVVGLFSDQCDNAVRDHAMHTIYSLVCLSLGWRRVIAYIPLATQTLRRIAMSQPKSEHTSRAAEIIRVLTMDPDNQLDILRYQKDLCIAALMDETCAGITNFNSISIDIKVKYLLFFYFFRCNFIIRCKISRYEFLYYSFVFQFIRWFAQFSRW